MVVLIGSLTLIVGYLTFFLILFFYELNSIKRGKICASLLKAVLCENKEGKQKNKRGEAGS